MRRWAPIAPLLLVGIMVTGCQTPQPATITTRSLLSEMTNLERLARWPSPAFTCRQFSSYDRHSTTEQDADTWFANMDRGYYLREEAHGGRTEYVMMDAAGPGAIVRIWSANPDGTLRVYLDHADEPIIEAPFKALLGGAWPGLPEPLAGQRSKGWNLYFPIPYAAHCKVTCDAKDLYYHINYRTYSADTPMQTFTPKDLEDLVGQIADVARVLREPAPPKVQVWGTGFEVPVGETTTALSLESDEPAALQELWLKVEGEEQALQRLTLRLVFDEHETVACPLVDFFGSGSTLEPYASLPMGVMNDGAMYSRWLMPFQQSVRVLIDNHGHDAVRAWLRVVPVEYEWAEDSLYFHAGWRTHRRVPTRPYRDLNVVTVAGQGVYVGTVLEIANPVKAWWGEGDEKIYVDNELFPSHFGTGTEDYFGYAWGSNEEFDHAYHAQPRADGPRSYGHAVNNRWHLLDCIPFVEQLQFDMELWHWWAGKVPEVSTLAYWYGRPEAEDDLEAPQPSDLARVSLAPYEPMRVPGAIEGEELRIVQRTGLVEVQEIDGCSNDRHLWWREGEPDDELILAFPVEEEGRYQVYARFVQAPDYGMVQLLLDGKQVREPLDLYAPRVTVSPEMFLGVFELSGGEHQLTIRMVGANPQAEKKYMCGLDYLRLRPGD